jgi:magnesium-protoporphyrin O-methyltransferase
MRRAECVELSGAYDEAAAALLAEHGLTGRCDRRAGDFAARPDLTAPADVVVLLKVLCCYPDAPRLLAAAAAKARRQVVISFPRAAWWVRAAAAVCALYPRLRGSDWRFVVHDPAEIRGALADAGLRPVRTEARGLWVLEVHERGPAVVGN